MRKIPVLEIFGPTIQGEGMVIGRKTMFVRTGGCDYSCSWCDSAFTWNGEEKATMMTATEVFLELVKIGSVEGTANFNHVTISGGNPALIGEPMAELVEMLHTAGFEVGLETQGTFWKDWMAEIDDLTISPKPPSSGMKTDFDKLDMVIDNLDNHAVEIADGVVTANHTLKVVIFNDEDFEYAKIIAKRYEGVPFFVSVGNEDAKEDGDISSRLLSKLDWLWGKVLADPECNDWKPLPQLHTLVWANKRAV